MNTNEKFVHEIVKHLTNALIITEGIKEDYNGKFPSWMEDEVDALHSQLQKIAEVIKINSL